MQNYKNWMEAKRELQEAKEWLDNRVKIDSQDYKKYTLCVSLGNRSIEYCGQYAAGATNYHPHPEIFKKYLEKAIKGDFNTIAEHALLLMQSDVDQKALKAKADIEKAAEEIAQIEHTF